MIRIAGGSEWRRRYPSLLLLAGAVILAVFALPSSLILPEASPTQTLEYAPVPGQSSAANSGNFAGLGLGTSGTLSEAGLPPPPAPGLGAEPTTYQCVGNPPRQTEDPLAPPCVAYFHGDNGGATYNGVTAGEIRVVYYLSCYGSGYNEQELNTTIPCPALEDLYAPPPSWETAVPRALRIYQAYFNTRYQTYGRRVHFWVYYGRHESVNNENVATASDQRQDAAEVWESVHPFATLSLDVAWLGTEYFDQAMAGYGALSFDSQEERSAGFFSALAGKAWGYMPDLEDQVAAYVDYVCKKVVPNPVSFSGNPPDNGKPRKLGLLYVSPASNLPQFTQFGQMVEQGVNACGHIAVVHAFYTGQGSLAEDGGSDPTGVQGQQQATADMTDFRSQGVTTILWPQGLEPVHPDAGAKIGYLPEYVYAGDGVIDDFAPFRFQNQTAASHSVLVSPLPRTAAWSSELCGQIVIAAEQTNTLEDVTWGCIIYPYLRQFFTAIQVAGPRLSPGSIQDGFRAIPQRRASDPQTPACFYPSGSYTCVKDEKVSWWDPSGVAANSSGVGCWRLMQGGERYLAGEWPAGDPLAQKSPNDPCDGYTSDHYSQPGTYAD